MKMTKLSCLIGIVIFGFMSGIVYNMFIVQNTEQKLPIQTTTSPIKGPTPLDEIAPKVSYNDLKSTLINTKNEYFLPTSFPSSLKPTTTYIRNGIYLICYSAKGYEKVGEAELTIQITPGNSLPLNRDAQLGGKFFTIGPYATYYDAKASNAGDSNYVALYGDTCQLLIINIKNNNYWLRVIPSINYSDILKTVESMTIVK